MVLIGMAGPCSEREVQRRTHGGPSGPAMVQDRSKSACAAPAVGRLPSQRAPSGNGRFDQVCTLFGPNLDRNCPRIIVIWIFNLVVLSKWCHVASSIPRLLASLQRLALLKVLSRACLHVCARSVRIHGAQWQVPQSLEKRVDRVIHGSRCAGGVMTRVTEQAEASARPAGEHAASDGVAGDALESGSRSALQRGPPLVECPGVTAREGSLHAASRSRVARLLRG